jgi:glucokinase
LTPAAPGAAVTTVGVDVGGTKVLGVALAPDGTVTQEVRYPTPHGAEALIEAVVAAVTEVRTPDTRAVGVGLPGLVDRTGTLRFGPNLPGVVESPVGPRVAEATGLVVRADNDATCAAWAEHVSGAGRGVPDLLMVTLGTGIGGGLVLDDRLVRGANGFAGEIGHMVVDSDGVACTCGQRGCWERYASGTGLGRMAREAAQAGRGRRMVELAGGDAEQVRGEHATTAALEGDPEALVVMRRLAGWVGLGLASLVHVLDVDRIIVGGGLVEAGETLLDPVRSAFVDHLVAPDHRPAVDIVSAELGEQAGAIGAALLARDG